MGAGKLAMARAVAVAKEAAAVVATAADTASIARSHRSRSCHRSWCHSCRSRKASTSSHRMTSRSRNLARSRADAGCADGGCGACAHARECAGVGGECARRALCVPCRAHADAARQLARVRAHALPVHAPCQERAVAKQRPSRPSARARGGGRPPWRGRAARKMGQLRHDLRYDHTVYDQEIQDNGSLLPASAFVSVTRATYPSE